MERKWDGKVTLLIWGGLLEPVMTVLASMGSPGNMAFCIICSIRDTAGAAKFHTAAVVQYMRPEIVGLVAGSFAVSTAAKEYWSTSGSSSMIRFLLGMVTVIDALMLLGCPLQTVLRMAAGNLNAYVGLVGFVLGAVTGCFFLKRGFSLGRVYDARPESGCILPVILVVMLILNVTTTLFAASAEGPGSMYASVLISLAGGLIFGAAARRVRTCSTGEIRDMILMKNFDLFIVIAGLLVVMAVHNLAMGSFKLGFEGQPVTRTETMWNILGMYVVGLAAVLIGDCPLRQLILAGQEPGDVAANVVGMLVGAAVCHNPGLVPSGTDTTTTDRAVCAVYIVLLLVIGFSCKGKQEK